MNRDYASSFAADAQEILKEISDQEFSDFQRESAQLLNRPPVSLENFKKLLRPVPLDGEEEEVERLLADVQILAVMLRSSSAPMASYWSLAARQLHLSLRILKTP